MVSISTTQFWIAAAVIIVIMAVLGFVVGKYVVKTNEMSKLAMYTGISVLLGVGVSTGLWFTIVDKKNVISAAKSMDTPYVTQEDYIDSMRMV